MKKHLVSILAFVTAIAALAIAIHANNKEDTDTLRTKGIRSGLRFPITLENQTKAPVYLFVDADLPNRMLTVAPGTKAVLDGVPQLSHVRAYGSQKDGQPGPGAICQELVVMENTVLTIQE